MDEVVLEEALPVVGDLPGRRVGGGQLPGVALGGEPVGAGLPGHRLEGGRVVGEEGADARLRVGLLHGGGSGMEGVPGPRHLDLVPGEEVLAVVVDLRRGVEGDGPVAAAESGELDGLRQQLPLQLGRHVRGDVPDGALADELGEGRVLDAHQVGRVARLDRVGNLGVAARGARGDLLEPYLRVAVGGVERVHGLLRALGPAPVREGHGALASGGATAAAAGRQQGQGGEAAG